MGYLGWSYDQVLDTPFAQIERAYEGRLEMLAKCFGGGEEAEPVPEAKAPDPAAVKAVFRSATKT